MANHHLLLLVLQLVAQVQAHHREAQPAHSPRLTILLEHYLNKLYQLFQDVAKHQDAPKENQQGQGGHEVNAE